MLRGGRVTESVTVSGLKCPIGVLAGIPLAGCLPVLYMKFLVHLLPEKCPGIYFDFLMLARNRFGANLPSQVKV